MVRLTKRRRKAYRQQYYQANRSEALNKNKDNYKLNTDNRKEAYKHKYQQKIKYYKKNYYAKNADEIRSALRKLYASNSPPSIAALLPPRRPPELRYRLQRPPEPRCRLQLPFASLQSRARCRLLPTLPSLLSRAHATPSPLPCKVHMQCYSVL